MIPSDATPLQVQSEQRKRGCLYYVKRGLMWFGIAVFALIAAGFIFETIMQAGDAQRYPPFGQLVEVDGYTMHIHCVGEGSPTVILESGAGGFSVQNVAQQEAFRHDTRVCVYDRAGMGWSDPRPERRTAWQIVHELHTLLINANVEPPYVMVGPSNGGLYVRSYAAEYPDEVVGLVLLDPTNERSLSLTQGLPLGVWVFMGRTGLFRIVGQSLCPSCTTEGATFLAARRGYPSTWQTYDAEWQMLTNPDEITDLIDQLGQPGALGDTALVVITANQQGVPVEQMDAASRAYYEEKEQVMTSLSSNYRYLTVMSDHGLSDQGELVNRSIRDVIDSARTGEPLATEGSRAEAQ
jgi:pimeloyl-ACP methyl ester carboxylesterase